MQQRCSSGATAVQHERTTAGTGEVAEEFDLGEIPGRTHMKDEMPPGWDEALELLGTGEVVDAVSRAALTITQGTPPKVREKRQISSVRPLKTGASPFGVPAKEAKVRGNLSPRKVRKEKKKKSKVKERREKRNARRSAGQSKEPAPPEELLVRRDIGNPSQCACWSGKRDCSTGIPRECKHQRDFWWSHPSGRNTKRRTSTMYVLGTCWGEE